MASLNLARRFLERLRRPRIDETLADTIARSIGQVEPRLRDIRGYPSRYADAIAHGWDYCQGLADQIPGPILVNRQSFAQNPLVHALFGSPDGIVQALSRSRAMRHWQEDAARAGEVFALMGMRHREKHILGMEANNGMLQREVPQKAVYFSDHTLSCLGATQEEARDLLARQFMESLLARVRERLDGLRRERRDMEIQRDELLARLHSVPGDAALRRDLNRTLAALAENVAAQDLRGYAGHFDAVMSQPEQYLGLRNLSMSLDAMGIQRPDREDPQAQRLDLREMTSRDRRHWVVILVRCSLEGLPPYQDRLAMEERWLTI